MSYYYLSAAQFESEKQLIYGRIPPSDLRDYARTTGWEFIPEAYKDALFVANNQRFPGRQINFPFSSSAPDYADAIQIAIIKIAELEQKPLDLIIAEIQEIKDDTLRFRVINTRNEDSFIPLSYAVSAINGAKEMFVSAACSVLKPQSHHPRMNRSEALELIDKSKFRQTEKGSFVLKVSSPLKAMNIQVANLFADEHMPFVRQTTLTINKGLKDLVTAIQTDTLGKLIDDIKQGNDPYISSNFCKAVTDFQEEHDDFDLWVDFKWAGSLALPEHFAVAKEIKIQRDYFSRIDDVRRELRDTDQQRKKEDVFVASVEHLAGEIGEDGFRSGDVILNLLMDDEIIKARTTLNSSQYRDADKAHMTINTFVKIKGKLHPGNQPRQLTDVSVFDLITS